MGKIFGGGGTSYEAAPPVERRVSLPGWVEKGGEDLYKQAQQTAARPYPTFPVADRVEPFGADTQQGFDVARGTVGQWEPYLDSAKSYTTGAVQISAEDIDRYLSPYLDTVAKGVTDNMLRYSGEQRIARSSSQAARGSFLNEDRRAVIDDMARRTEGDVLQQALAQIYNSGFGQALNAAGAEKSRGFNAANLMSLLGQTNQKLGLTDAATLGTIGQTQEGKSQQLRDLTYEDFMRAFAYPQQQQEFLRQMMAGIPTGQTTTTTGQQVPVQKNNGFVQSLGALATIAGAVSGQPWLMAAGAAGSAAGQPAGAPTTYSPPMFDYAAL